MRQSFTTSQMKKLNKKDWQTKNSDKQKCLTNKKVKQTQKLDKQILINKNVEKK